MTTGVVSRLFHRAGEGSRSPLRLCLPLVTYSLTTAACSGVQSALDPAGPEASRVSRLWWLMLAVCTIVFLIVIVVLAWGLIRKRTTTPAPERSDLRLKRMVSGATVASALILLALLVASVLTGRAITAQPEKGVLTIEVTGHQWWWEVRYDDPVPALMIKTANEIHVPVGQLVMFKLTSHDVIHSLWVPNLSGKRDLIPGHLTTMWIQADKPGVFRGQCAEFCGHQHAHMSLLVIAEPPANYAAWFDSQVKPSALPSDSLVARGRQVFLTSRCVMCHTIRGTTAAASLGPDLTHVASRKTIAAATLENTPGHLGGWIVNSQSIKPGNKMPPNDLRSEDLQALLSYLETLK